MVHQVFCFTTLPSTTSAAHSWAMERSASWLQGPVVATAEES